ncbi:hypothetical protein GCM10011591_40530 [Nocardia camponoti]|uniref:Collagen-like protein n=1 Tax=Nocardia camponoti TaxID=1616106 RepID=A0A917VDL2_9NOCA|nr:hypothetical protein GCM10011591_40530 [Nocardia camponoti]
MLGGVDVLDAPGLADGLADAPGVETPGTGASGRAGTSGLDGEVGVTGELGATGDVGETDVTGSPAATAPNPSAIAANGQSTKAKIVRRMNLSSALSRVVRADRRPATAYFRTGAPTFG